MRRWDPRRAERSAVNILWSVAGMIVLGAGWLAWWLFWRSR